ncbi:MAG: ubiquinone/menaquinone biosynthesis methyltransferase [Planctomycetota bacterium]
MNQKTTAAHPFLNKDRQRIRTLFDHVAPRYDFLNHLLSFNLDRIWRRSAIAELPREGVRFLDACAGTGDLSIALCRQRESAMVYATDFSLPMLATGQAKAQRFQGQLRFLAGDTLRLPFADSTFHGAAVAFGIRNVEHLEAGLKELGRVLAPGGKLVLLEFTPYRNRWLRPFFHLYTHRLLPAVGNWLSGSRERANPYLQQSVDRWPTGDELAAELENAGYRDVSWRALFPGNVALHTGQR